MLNNRVGPLKMTVRSSVLWKLLMQLAKKWTETVLKCPTPRVVRFISDQSLSTVCFLMRINYIIHFLLSLQVSVLSCCTKVITIESTVWDLGFYFCFFKSGNVLLKKNVCKKFSYIWNVWDEYWLAAYLQLSTIWYTY